MANTVASNVTTNAGTPKDPAQSNVGTASHPTEATERRHLAAPHWVGPFKPTDELPADELGDHVVLTPPTPNEVDLMKALPHRPHSAVDT